ncbi:hypothetical protein HanPSC8_Chr11g0474001 [Helianthus annuus]|nr:hypothetical protein HanIR_Chr11g0529601 [Helianthus annuus]KAJ0875252.1 hypothetical protein HanPSC8_Chr11g0474001 [Helianthus annuus]
MSCPSFYLPSDERRKDGTKYKSFCKTLLTDLVIFYSFQHTKVMFVLLFNLMCPFQGKVSIILKLMSCTWNYKDILKSIFTFQFTFLCFLERMASKEKKRQISSNLNPIQHFQNTNSESSSPCLSLSLKPGHRNSISGHTPPPPTTQVPPSFSFLSLVERQPPHPP